jgi:hypothetical protein
MLTSLGEVRFQLRVRSASGFVFKVSKIARRKRSCIALPAAASLDDRYFVFPNLNFKRAKMQSFKSSSPAALLSENEKDPDVVTLYSCVRQVQQKGSWVCGRREAAGAERSPLGRARRSARGGVRQLAAW